MQIVIHCWWYEQNHAPLVIWQAMNVKSCNRGSVSDTSELTSHSRSSGGRPNAPFFPGFGFLQNKNTTTTEKRFKPAAWSLSASCDNGLSLFSQMTMMGTLRLLQVYLWTKINDLRVHLCKVLKKSMKKTNFLYLRRMLKASRAQSFRHHRMGTGKENGHLKLWFVGGLNQGWEGVRHEKQIKAAKCINV